MTHHGKSPARGSSSDRALWITCGIINDVVNDRVPGESYEPTLSGAPQSDYLVGGDVRVDTFWARYRPAYFRSSPTRMADVMGLAVLASTQPVVAGTGADALSLNRSQWHKELTGELMVSRDGIFVRSHSVVIEHVWRWAHIEKCEVVDTNTIIFSNSRDKTVRRLRSEWAELAFALWALERDTWNLQLALGTWLPSQWPTATEGERNPAKSIPQRVPEDFNPTTTPTSPISIALSDKVAAMSSASDEAARQYQQVSRHSPL